MIAILREKKENTIKEYFTVQDTKKNIFNTAETLFLQKGYDKTKVEDICDACNITKTTFYYHFHSKEDLILHMYDPITDTLIQQLISLFNEKNYWKQLLSCFDYLIDESEKYGHDVCSHTLIANLKEDHGSYDLRNNLTNLLVGIIQKAQESGQVRNKKPAKELYYASAYAFLGYELTWCIKKGKFNRKQEVKKAMENLFDIDVNLCK